MPKSSGKLKSLNSVEFKEFFAPPLARPRIHAEFLLRTNLRRTFYNDEASHRNEASHDYAHKSCSLSMKRAHWV